MHPAYPSNAALAAEAEAERLLAEQDTANVAFKAALTAFSAVFDKLYFPLGSPVTGYDLADINAVIADWTVLREPSETEAYDAAQVA